MKYEVHWVEATGGCTGEVIHDKHHGTFDTLKEAMDSVRAWWKKNGFDPYYVRQMTDEKGRIWWDYGLHSAFYVFKGV
jgi:hypothetical protein